MKGDFSHGDQKAARLVASALREDASAHEAGDFGAIGEQMDRIHGEVLALCGDLSDGISIGITFWDDWADARNHEWMYHEGIGQDDWPRLARHVADAIESGAPITDPILVRQYSSADRPGLLTRILGRLRRSRSGAD